MTPTPAAQTWAPKINHALAALESAFAEAEAFTPSKAVGRISIIGTDMIESLLFPRLLAQLSREAPDVVLMSRPSDGSFPKSDMEQGIIDFAIAGFFGGIPEGFYQQHVADETYCSIVRKSHPIVKSKLDLERFVKLSHVLVSPQGDLSGVVDAALAKLKLKRRIAAGLTTFQVIGKLISETDFCATLPTSVAEMHAKLYGLNIFEPPVKLPSIRLMMIWHQRIHTSPLHQWIRREIQRHLAEIFRVK